MEAWTIYKVVYSSAKLYQERGWTINVRFAWLVARDDLLDIIRNPGWWNASLVVMTAIYERAT